MMKSSSAARLRTMIALCLISVLGLSSCLDIETSIRIGGNGAVKTRLLYRLSAEAAHFGRGFGADEPWPFPLTEKDFIQRTVANDGTTVKRYKNGTDSDGTEWIRVDLESDSIVSLASYLDLDIAVERTEDRGGRMTMTLPSANSWNDADENLKEAFSESASGSSFVFRLRPPKNPSDAGIGSIDGRYAVYETTLSELLSAETVTEWTVVW